MILPPELWISEAPPETSWALKSMSGETVTVSVTTWMLPRPANDRLFLWRPRSKFPMDDSTNKCLTNAVLLGLLLLAISWLRPPIQPLRNLSTLHRSCGALTQSSKHCYRPRN
ncbi:hypothetical protein ATANTOWER_032364 [Ataeniobius toweri]|uniref:Uncharacterized protein n=1 Tax=Ataeniobius toweri TaxID=208326 RepID=A0ABU7B3T3_9TELE|nr:hypothetical protein [Ataeniobius toweri]